jgi:hypothetical protein
MALILSLLFTGTSFTITLYYLHKLSKLFPQKKQYLYDRDHLDRRQNVFIFLSRTYTTLKHILWTVFFNFSLFHKEAGEIFYCLAFQTGSRSLSCLNILGIFLHVALFRSRVENILIIIYRLLDDLQCTHYVHGRWK